ncbi:MAG: PEP-CTERM sorting domain-containing protein [Fimbriimonadaceae bacterium]|nr:PEP-CTERM sorting domain-containing protein [Fimbriimonadaceae bacterium]
MNVNAYDGISGVSLSKGSGFLAGVFLGSTYPGSPPASLAFSNPNGSGGIATSFASLSPVIGQVFFIGDGLTGTGSGSTQIFNVPNSATTLYLGFTDANGYVGAPGQFQDNAGALTASFRVVPEPSILSAFFLAASGLALRRRRSTNG